MTLFDYYKKGLKDGLKAAEEADLNENLKWIEDHYGIEGVIILSLIAMQAEEANKED